MHNPQGHHPVVLICEHASAYIPAEYKNLGLDPVAVKSHIAWDPGAAVLAREMSAMLDSVLVESAVSRLVYDCNRPPEAPSAMPAQSEVYAIPGNRSMTQAQKEHRITTCYRPFEALVTQTLNTHAVTPVLVTIHSFTPIFHGKKRDVEIGLLHDNDSRLTDALLDIADVYEVRRNEPYAATDGVTHTLQLHGLSRGIHNVMIEVRNDLLATNEQCHSMAATLTGWISRALAGIDDRNSPAENARHPS
ncbi:MAG: N-formylglutamate amidohydrolase [Gammaproteobacteria bacterium]|nr:N-formylglutamate amidohydrolase [Gammaproteobacteria bacterium]